MSERSRRRTAVPARACRTIHRPCMTGTRILLSSSLLLRILLGASKASAAEQGPESTVRDERVTVEDVIPLTVGNLRGRKMLYNEGWFIVTSSDKALEFAKEHALFIIFIILMMLRNHKSFTGHLFMMYLIFYAVLRFIIEFFRGDVARGFIMSGLSVSQGISLLLLIAGIAGYAVLRKRKPVI